MCWIVWSLPSSPSPIIKAFNESHDQERCKLLRVSRYCGSSLWGSPLNLCLVPWISDRWRILIFFLHYNQGGPGKRFYLTYRKYSVKWSSRVTNNRLPIKIFDSFVETIKHQKRSTEEIRGKNWLRIYFLSSKISNYIICLDFSLPPLHWYQPCLAHQHRQRSLLFEATKVT